MLFRTAADKRPFHLGTYPLDSLPRDAALGRAEAERPQTGKPAGPGPAPHGALAQTALAKTAHHYRGLFAEFAQGEVAPVRAPVPDDLGARVIDIKGYGYFMDASQVGVCRMPEAAWLSRTESENSDTASAGPGELERAGPAAQGFAIVLLVAHGRVPEPDNLARGWIAPAVEEIADMRVAEIAVCVAGHIRQMGFAARAHFNGECEADLERLAVLAGLAVRDGETLRNPFIEGGFALAAITTEYELSVDAPLARKTARAKGLRYWRGINGAMSGRERNRRAKRATHLGPFPMETVRRVDRPTTLILDAEVPRVPRRAGFFDRALRGDLGEKSTRERNRFAFKQPHAAAMMAPMRAMVPIQGGAHDADADTAAYADPGANARAIKSLGYHMGVDFVGICEVPRYAWYSHGPDGEPIEPYHTYAVVMLIDQGYDTMEGASGDDWISGAQSMRAYLRGGEIAGIMADTVRQLGFPARSQTNVDSDVLHIPLLLWAGLGEMSRIGELVLNPFIGPRLKSVVFTTDMPLEIDKPIDFGLQYFCNNCQKCARECPCDAIPLGDKVMFNGYEIWKPDVERCARYRLTNTKGSACGRCMKTCPLNKVVTMDGPLVERAASWLGLRAFWLKPLMVPIAVKLDDTLGHGKRVPVKKWWLDLEVIDGVCVTPKGINTRDLDLSRNTDPAKQKIATYPASMMPVPNDNRTQPVDRKTALAATALLETPDEAKARHARGEAPPAHYTPTPPAAGGPKGPTSAPTPYQGIPGQGLAGSGKAARR